MLLYYAIIQTLRDNGNTPMTYKEIANKLSQNNYYEPIAKFPARKTHSLENL
jgi:hypothetical protein